MIARVDAAAAEAVGMRRLHGNDVGVSGSPRKGAHAHVHIVAPVFADLEYGGHAESGAGMSVILYGDIGVLGLDAGTDAPE